VRDVQVEHHACLILAGPRQECLVVALDEPDRPVDQVGSAGAQLTGQRGEERLEQRPRHGQLSDHSVPGCAPGLDLHQAAVAVEVQHTVHCGGVQNQPVMAELLPAHRVASARDRDGQATGPRLGKSGVQRLQRVHDPYLGGRVEFSMLCTSLTITPISVPTTVRTGHPY
jgi:hypothetical protein